MADPVVLKLANDLAEECLQAQKEIGDDRLFMEVGETIGASSQTLEEAFLTSIRTRMASDKARDFMAQKIKAHRSQAASE